MKRCPMSLIIREMQITTTMRGHLGPVRMAIPNKSTDKCGWGCGERGPFMHCWWECWLVQPLWKAVWRYFKKLKMQLLYNPVIPLLGIYPKKPQNTKSKEHKHPYVHCSVIYNCQDMEATEVSTGRWLDKEDVVHIYNRILLIHKKRKKSCYSQQHG